FLLGFNLFEHEVVVLVEEFFLFHQLESVADNLFRKNLLPSPDVVQYPLPALALDPAKVDYHQLASRTQRSVNRGHGLVWELEVMVGVADEGQVNRIRRQINRGW